MVYLVIEVGYRLLEFLLWVVSWFKTVVPSGDKVGLQGAGGCWAADLLLWCTKYLGACLYKCRQVQRNH